jgi:hypothetical protein
MKSHALLFKDFDTGWYKRWAKELKQDSDHLDGHQLRANKFWQNACICQAIYERTGLKPGNKGIGFGVGQERLPAVFAKNGIKVAATDQDYTTDKAKYWSERELATGSQSLNKHHISEPDIFIRQIEYIPVDMTKIPERLFGQYDFVWSNCALGHLGSIQAGLGFIEKSLKCLVPGGVAVHTTELNILSDNQTVESGVTVIFRLKDIYELFVKLTEKGYNCSPLRFDLGRTEEDFRISMQPKFGNDFSKIQVGGHIITQAVLIITKPKKRPMLSSYIKRLRLMRLKRSYQKGLSEIDKFSKRNPNIRQLLESQNISLGLIDIKPAKRHRTVLIKQGKAKEIFLDFSNWSQIGLYSAYGHLLDTPPILLGTAKPQNRPSDFADPSWVAGTKNRPSSDFHIKKEGRYIPTDNIPPGQNFAFRTTLNSNHLEKGDYWESFAVLQEGVRWIDDSDLEVSIRVV